MNLQGRMHLFNKYLFCTYHMLRTAVIKQAEVLWGKLLLHFVVVLFLFVCLNKNRGRRKYRQDEKVCEGSNQMYLSL